MSMKVHYVSDLPIFSVEGDVSLDIDDFTGLEVLVFIIFVGVLLPDRAVPLSVQVDAIKVGPVIADLNSVWIYHGDDSYFIVFADKLRILVLGKQVLNEPLNHERARSLAWMLPGQKKDQGSDFVGSELRIGLFDDERLNFVTGQSFGHDSNFLAPVSFVVDLLNFLNVVIEVCSGVWIALSHFDDIVGVLCSDSKGESVVVLA
jgi:hypothetical protein